MVSSFRQKRNTGDYGLSYSGKRGTESMNYEEAMRLANSINSNLSPDDKRFERVVKIVQSNRTTETHRAFVEKHGAWYFVFVRYGIPEVVKSYINVCQFEYIPIEGDV